ncbi:MAG: VOC family protein [Desulfosalsimonadaceae bacterium]
MNQNSPFTMNGINFPKLNQIGILVKDIPEAAAYYSKLLGIGPWFRSKTIRHDLVFRDKPITLDLDLVIAFRGGMEYELIQVRGGAMSVSIPKCSGKTAAESIIWGPLYGILTGSLLKFGKPGYMFSSPAPSPQRARR